MRPFDPAAGALSWLRRWGPQATGATWSGRPLIDPPSWQALRRALPLGASAVLNTGLGLTALRSMPVPLYGAVRRSGVVVTLAMETLTGQAPAAALSTRTRVATAVASVLVVVGAAAAAVAQGVRDVPLLGLALTLTSNVVTAVNGSLVSALSVGLLDASPTASRAGPDLKQKRRLAPFTLMFYNAAVMAPLSLLIALATGELAVLRTMQWSGATVAYLLLSSVLGICVTVCAFWTTEAFSPLASAIAGNIKDVPLLFMPWSDFTPTLLGYAGVALNLGGSSLFVLARSG